MKTTKETAAEMRRLLKDAGWNSRKVSVRMETYSLGSSIHVVVKSADVPISRVRELVAGFERVHRCEATGEILGGGNLYVHVGYDSAAVAPKRASVLAAISGREPGEVVDFEGVRIWRCTHDGDYFWIDAGDDHAAKCYGVEFTARTVAERILGE